VKRAVVLGTALEDKDLSYYSAVNMIVLTSGKIFLRLYQHPCEREHESPAHMKNSRPLKKKN